MIEVLPQAQAAGAEGRSRTPSSARARSSTSDGAGGGRRRGRSRDLPVPAAAGRARAAERVGEGDARAVPVEPPAQGGAAGAAGQRVDCSLAELGAQEGRRVGHGRRHDRRVQADPHEEGRPDDVRHPRRPRGPGRDARLQLRLRAERGQGGRRPHGARARARRPQGGGRDQARRPGGRAVRADRRRRCCAPPRRPRPSRSSGGSRCTSSPGVPDELPRGAQGGRGAPPAATTSSCWRWASGGWCSGPTTACRRTAPAAPS